jgi:anti-anti-sigma factor
MATISSTEIDGVKVIHLAGSLTCEGVEQVNQAFEAEILDGKHLVIDLTGVDLVATPGLRMLLSADRVLKHTGGRMVLTGSNPFVLDVLHRSKLDTVWPLVPSREEALRVARIAPSPPGKGLP